MFCLRFIFVCIFFCLSFSLFGEDFKFKKVSFYGLNYFSEEFIFNKISDSKSCYEFDENSLLSKLGELNLFNKIDIYWNYNELKVFLVEKPIINLIKVYSDKDKDYILSLMSRLDLLRGEFYDVSNLIQFKNQIEEFYTSNGFNDPSIDISVELNDEFNYVDIYVSISKNFLQKIKNIDILGAHLFNKNKLLSLLSYSKTNWMSWFLKDNIFLPDLIESDLDALKSYYLDRGYSDFQIDFIRVFLSDDNKDVDILLSIFEGEKYSIWTIDLVGDKSIFPSNELYQSFSDILFSALKSGDCFSRQKLIDIRTKMKDFFFKIGFLNAEVNFMVFYAGETRVKVDFIFNKSIRSRIRHINFMGNFLTCDNILRRMIPVVEGAGLSIDDIEFGKEEIIRNGISESVNIEYVKNPDDIHEMDVVYFIEEQKFGKITAGLSYGNDEGFTVNFTTELANFLGIGSDISLDVNNNGIESDFSFTYCTPYFLGERFGLGYNVYYKSDLFDQDIDDFDSLSETFGAYLYYSFELSKFEKINFGLGCDMTFLGMYDESSSNEIKSFVERYGFDFKEYYFNLVWTYNALDRFYYPTAGFYHNLNLRINIPGSKSKYYTVNYDFNYYNNFYDDFILNISSSLFYGNAYGDDDVFPFFKNFYIKGANNIRGFKERTLGPQDSNEDSIGGNLLLCTKFSLYVPNPLPEEFKDIKTSLFFDIGQVYNTRSYSDEDFRNKMYYYFSSLKCALGISFLWSTPFGLPLEIAIAYPFNVEDEDSKSIFSISLG